MAAFTIVRESPKGWRSRKVTVSGANEVEATSRLAAWLVYGHRTGVRIQLWYPTGDEQDPTPRYKDELIMPAKVRQA